MRAVLFGQIHDGEVSSGMAGSEDRLCPRGDGVRQEGGHGLPQAGSVAGDTGPAKGTVTKRGVETKRAHERYVARILVRNGHNSVNFWSSDQILDSLNESY